MGSAYTIRLPFVGTRSTESRKVDRYALARTQERQAAFLAAESGQHNNKSYMDMWAWTWTWRLHVGLRQPPHRCGAAAAASNAVIMQ